MPTDFRISDLPTSIPFNNLDLMEVSQVDSQSPSGYSSVKKTMEEIGEKLLNDIQYSSALATTNKKIIPAINEVNSNIPENSDFSLSGLSDTTITSPSSGQLLSYDGGTWVNGSLFGLVKTKTLEGTTTASGALAHGLDLTKHLPLFAAGADVSNLNRVGFLRSQGDTYLTVISMSSAVAPVTNISVKLILYYI